MHFSSFFPFELWSWLLFSFSNLSYHFFNLFIQFLFDCHCETERKNSPSKCNQENASKSVHRAISLIHKNRTSKLDHSGTFLLFDETACRKVNKKGNKIVCNYALGNRMGWVTME